MVFYHCDIYFQMLIKKLKKLLTKFDLFINQNSTFINTLQVIVLAYWIFGVRWQVSNTFTLGWVYYLFLTGVLHVFRWIWFLGTLRFGVWILVMHLAWSMWNIYIFLSRKMNRSVSFRCLLRVWDLKIHVWFLNIQLGGFNIILYLELRGLFMCSWAWYDIEFQGFSNV